MPGGATHLFRSRHRNYFLYQIDIWLGRKEFLLEVFETTEKIGLFFLNFNIKYLFIYHTIDEVIISG